MRVRIVSLGGTENSSAHFRRSASNLSLPVRGHAMMRYKDLAQVLRILLLLSGPLYGFAASAQTEQPVIPAIDEDNRQTEPVSTSTDQQQALQDCPPVMAAPKPALSSPGPLTSNSPHTHQSEPAGAALPSMSSPLASLTSKAASLPPTKPKTQAEVNYAAEKAGAVVLQASQSLIGAKHLLDDDKDKYARSPCDQLKWVIINLSEDIRVHALILANYEKFSSTVKEFEVLYSIKSPSLDEDSDDWTQLGHFYAKEKAGEQRFDVDPPRYARYLKFRMLSHWHNEFYCTLSQVKVYGSTLQQGFMDDWQKQKLHLGNHLDVIQPEARAAATESSEALPATADTLSEVADASSSAPAEPSTPHNETQAAEMQQTRESDPVEAAEEMASRHLSNETQLTDIRDTRSAAPCSSGTGDSWTSSSEGPTLSESIAHTEEVAAQCRKMHGEESQSEQKTGGRIGNLDVCRQNQSSPAEAYDAATPGKSGELPLTRKGCPPIISAGTSQHVAARPQCMHEPQESAEKDSASRVLTGSATPLCQAPDDQPGAQGCIRQGEEKGALTQQATARCIDTTEAPAQCEHQSPPQIEESSPSMMSGRSKLEYASRSEGGLSAEETPSNDSSSPEKTSCQTDAPPVPIKLNVHEGKALTAEDLSLQAETPDNDGVKQKVEQFASLGGTLKPVPESPPMSIGSASTAATSRFKHRCLEKMGLAEFKREKLAKLQEDVRRRGGPSLGSGSPYDNIFKTLMDEMTALEINQSIFDVYVGNLHACFVAVLEELRADNEKAWADSISRVSEMQNGMGNLTRLNHQLFTRLNTSESYLMASAIICLLSGVSVVLMAIIWCATQVRRQRRTSVLCRDIVSNGGQHMCVKSVQT